MNPRDGKFNTALEEEFGALFERLYGDLREPQFDFLREAFSQDLNNRLREHYDRLDGFASIATSEDDEYISVRDARRLLKIGHYSILDLVKTGVIGVSIRNQDRTLRYLLRLADVELLRPVHLD